VFILPEKEQGGKPLSKWSLYIELRRKKKCIILPTKGTKKEKAPLPSRRVRGKKGRMKRAGKIKRHD